ncbi:restriction endonuclease subunit S [Acinetobacter baumannii]|uniref:restriction endonuclease subunit S n=1 Tax=Acinetobacter baumannii TaxID=470 RepID=UPI001BCAE75E|nr:restriction endonuclease subunit S [Acinetobacter baumannii]EKW4940761.1 restriction endonuclease subunit S [Acinetobacter baumannii]ELS4600197.1 restriction endonuclease subunit S [Acinetobacter baumannii]MCA4305076.1 restriction endonuclease subunit S [Acinetobacter baumannii]MDC4811955.1 restriction endonuclease subunit S [Acinetobacter baumannii]
MSVPKLRFKEFDGAWISTNIQGLVDQNILDKPMDGNHGEIHPTSADYVENGIPFVMATDVFDGNVYLDKSKKITKEQADTLRKGFSIEGDILLTHKATIGNVAKVPKLDTPYIMLTPQVTYYRVIDYEKLVPDFIKSSFESKKFQNELIALCTGATRLYIGISEQRKLPFSYPSKSEQTKIASFLSAVDEKISQLTQKHELLSQYKQGMMQKLFSQQIRFKADDGSEFDEWETDLIRDVFTNKSKNYNPQIGKNLPCIELEHLSQNTGKILGTIESCEQQSTKNLFEKNSVLFGKLRPYLRKFAKPQFKGVCSSEIWVLTGLKISNEYLFQYIQSEHFSELTNIQSGSKMPRADWNVISEAEIEYPCIAEQTKIANFLSSIDQKIEVVAQQIEQAKQWKKGLLQQMFV